jgi:serralysin
MSIIGTDGNDTLMGTEFADISILGLAGDDTIYGYGGDDIIDAGEGNDVALGGTGNDVILGRDGNDQINGNEGNDTIYGEAGNDAINGEAGDDFIDGGYGDDTLVDGAGNNSLYGEDGNDLLVTYGSSSNNLFGGTGNDTYELYSSGNTVYEDAGGGIDLIRSAIDVFSLANNVENLTLSGSAYYGFANDLDNTIIGNDSANYLYDNVGNDSIDAKGGNDFVYGGNGSDILDGGTGADRLEGGNGNDTYIVDNSGDDIVDSPMTGIETVKSSINWSLDSDPGLDNLFLTGGAYLGVGSSLDNQIKGTYSPNLLSGKGGNDTLTGYGASDYFQFESIYDGMDTITDFNVGEDSILILRSGFSSSLSTGSLPADQFRIGSAAADANDYFIYNSATGALSFDADGTGGAAQIQFAKLSTGIAMTSNNISVR